MTPPLLFYAGRDKLASSYLGDQRAFRAKPQGAEIELGHWQGVDTVGEITQINALVVAIWQMPAIHRVNFPGIFFGLYLAEVIPHTLPRFADSTGRMLGL